MLPEQCSNASKPEPMTKVLKPREGALEPMAGVPESMAGTLEPGVIEESTGGVEYVEGVEDDENVVGCQGYQGMSRHAADGETDFKTLQFFPNAACSRLQTVSAGPAPPPMDFSACLSKPQ